MPKHLKPLILIITLSMIVALSMLTMPIDHAQASPGDVALVSCSSGGEEGNDHSGSPRSSADGRCVAFSSQATNLVPGGTTGYQVFCKDLDTGVVALASCDAAGAQGNSGSYAPGISPDGRYVVFHSDATNLVAGGTSGRQVFRKDLDTGVVVLVSCNASGVQGNGSSEYASVSSGGACVAFDSVATNLVTPATSSRQVFHKNLTTGTVTLVSCSSEGVEGNTAGNITFNPNITPDGGYVGFRSDATNLIPGGTTNRQAFAKEIATGDVEIISCDSSVVQGDDHSGSPTLTSDLAYAVFASHADNLVAGSASTYQQVFRKDLATGEVALVSCDSEGALGNSSSESPTVSEDGSYVAFTSLSTNLVEGGTASNRRSIFRKDLATGDVVLASCDSSGSQADERSTSARISADGKYVAFASVATDLVTPATSNWQIFRKELPTSRLAVTSVAPVEAMQYTLWMDITLQGDDFQPGAAVKLEKGTTVLNPIITNVVSDTEIVCAVSIFFAEPGVYDVVVTNMDAQEARLEEAFTITSACGGGSGMALLMLGLMLGLLSLGGTYRLRARRRGEN